VKPLPLKSPPDSLCLLRLSAIGDVCHAVPVIRTLQAAWPQTRLTWVIGETEHALVGDIPGVEFITFDKQAGWRALRELRRHLNGRRFDVLLHMQMSLRASLASLAIPADIRLGFDRERANDLQWLFTNARIPHIPRQHVLESFLEFPKALGITDTRLEWRIPIPTEARQRAHDLVPNRPYAVISPCSAHAYRNWTVEGYAAIADHLHDRWGLEVVLTGGNHPIEREYADAIARHCQCRPRDLVGRTDLKTLLAVLQGARLLVAPDSGPAHMGTAAGIPVVGLYAATNPDRARPYRSAELVISRYAEAVQARYRRPVDELPWGIRVREPGTMARIPVAAVQAAIEQALTRCDPQATP